MLQKIIGVELRAAICEAGQHFAGYFGIQRVIELVQHVFDIAHNVLSHREMVFFVEFFLTEGNEDAGNVFFLKFVADHILFPSGFLF